MKSAGRRFDGKSRLDDREWALIADAYCPRFKIAVLARIAVKAHKEAANCDGVDRAAAEERAKRAKIAYKDAVRKANLEDELLDADGEEIIIHNEALRGQLWIDKMTATVVGCIEHYEIELGAPTVSETTRWVSELGRVAREFVDTYDGLYHRRFVQIRDTGLETLSRSFKLEAKI